ncbi:FG-GAP-like repeat-containing protein [Hymenobacter sp. GOD-10R]|uniref:FG-GAP-like repeat-containing protein n=1 Tax=Hymenobacter sp. GOD-10R TaxID=3093922 RepID=UPI002D785A87|nr:FG-GAP-like repeat-containing protein [Hymenobacter sp. GOD-10R]WRQ26163.1 FG-GAP-like repeat-containing protein [Hymenobacter sp. GOD-10R]
MQNIFPRLRLLLASLLLGWLPFVTTPLAAAGYPFTSETPTHHWGAFPTVPAPRLLSQPDVAPRRQPLAVAAPKMASGRRAEPVTIVSLVRAGASPNGSRTLSYTLTLSDNVSGLSTANFRVITGSDQYPSVQNIIGSGAHYFITVSYGGRGSIPVQLILANSTGVTPTISGLPFAGEAYLVDRTLPPLDPPLISPTGFVKSPVTIEGYTEAYGRVSVYDSPSGTLRGTATADGSSRWHLPPAPFAEGIHTIYSYVTDVSGNRSGTRFQQFTVDNTPPQVTLSGPTGSWTSANPIPFTITFSESVENFTASDVHVLGGTVSSFTGNGTSYQVSVTPTSSTVQLNVPADVAQDPAGNGNLASTQFNVVYLAPVQVLGISRLDPPTIDAASVRYRILFSARPNAVSLTLNNFSLATTGLTGASLSSIGGGGLVFEVTVHTGTGSGTLRLDLTNSDGVMPGIANVPFQGETYVVQRPTAFRVVSTSPTRQALTAARSTNVAVTFNQPVSSTSASNVHVYSAQAGGRKASSVSGSGSTVTLDPSSDFKPGETVSVTVPSTVRSTGELAAMPYVYQFTTQVSGGTGSFGGGTNLAANAGAHSVAAADVDGDGDLDLLTTNERGNTVSVGLNNGMGTYTAGPAISVGRGPYHLATGDLDGDGDLDLVTANSSTIFPSTVSVRLNNGQGDFSSGSDVEVGRNPHGVALADVDGDGDLDLLADNYVANDQSAYSEVSVRLNDGTGRFSGTQQVRVGTRPLSIAVGDVDGDGDLDFVTANSNSTTASVRLNDGTGSFSGSLEVAVGANPESVALADIDVDGDLDLLVANAVMGTVSVVRNDGTGSFGSGQSIPVGPHPVGLVLSDVDGDGDLDVVTANAEASTASVRLNNGLGSFAAGSEVAVGNAPSGLVLADLDGDGDLDLATGNSASSSTSVRLNQNSGARVLANTNASATRLSEQLQVYPNPARKQVQLVLPAALTAAASPLQVTLYNSLGQAVLARTLVAPTTQPALALSSLPTGIYRLQVRAGQQQQTCSLQIE